MHEACLQLFLGVFCRVADEAEATVQHQVRNCVCCLCGTSSRWS